MHIKSYKEALRLSRAAGEDAAKRRMRKAGRKVMSQSDYDHAVEVTERVLVQLGFDVRSWISLAGVPRNEPEPPKAAPKPKRRAKAKATKPVQLNFGFA